MEGGKIMYENKVDGIIGNFTGQKLYTEEYVNTLKETFKDILNTCAFLRCCVACGENLSDEESEQIGNKIKEARKLL
jgi:3-deoxy-D-arabino-heptulosonate 7-phosphate (DAHP) synthase class II